MSVVGRRKLFARADSASLALLLSASFALTVGCNSPEAGTAANDAAEQEQAAQSD